MDFVGFRCNVEDETTYEPVGYTCCPDDYANASLTRCYCNADFVSCLPPADQIPDGCLQNPDDGGDLVCGTDPNDPDWECCTPDPLLSNPNAVVCWPSGEQGPQGYTCATEGTTGDPTGTSTGDVDACPGHRQYQCLGRMFAAYEPDNGGDESWSPPFIEIFHGGVDELEPIECYPADGYDVQGGNNPGLYGDPLVVCAPEALGDLTDPDDPMVEVIRGLCVEECQARPVPSRIPDTYTQANGTVWTRSKSIICEVGPDLSQLNGQDLLGGVLPCDAASNPPQIADVGQCDGGAGDPDECPLGDAALCRQWRPDLWVFSSTDSAGNVSSVVDQDFYDEIALGTGFACDAPAFVFSADGTGVSSIDGVQVNDFYERLGLVDGDTEFELRLKSSGTWSAWYPLDTYADAIYAFDNLESEAPTEFELRYESIVTSGSVTRSVKLEDCTAAGDSWRCDSRDL